MPLREANQPIILSLGATPYALSEPILRSCSAEQLLALEKNSPHLELEDQAVWQALCFRDFRKSEAQYEGGEFPEPDCWRKLYFECRRAEEERLEEVGSRIRTRREEVDQEKRHRQVIFTDALPPAKRARMNSGQSRPKTLFEKTRKESIKIQRLVYGPPTIPSLSVKAIRPRATTGLQATSPAKSMKPPSPNKSLTSNRNLDANPEQPVTSNSTTKPTGAVPPGGFGSSKKDPMSTLFMPKHKAHSQLPKPSQVISMRRK
ncbi:RNA polymerase II transcription factor SIII subunit A-domain-containing protein [Hysterangium stoloniferum]|nr:RNA polymerase II transcription factor SIII subunit A-domain-containing protein [Hysterangium stoloniferum]